VFSLFVRCRWVATRVQAVLMRLLKAARQQRRGAQPCACERAPNAPAGHAGSASPATRTQHLVLVLKVKD